MPSAEPIYQDPTSRLMSMTVCRGARVGGDATVLNAATVIQKSARLQLQDRTLIPR